MQKRSNPPSLLILALLPVLGLLAGCADQPYGYIFQPESRDQINAARQAAVFISSLYDHTDDACRLLSDAGLTTHYLSILPDGWVDSTRYDTSGNPASTSYTFIRNYMDTKYYGLQIPLTPPVGAIRNPSTVDYGYEEIASVQNLLNNTIVGRINESRKLKVGYSDGYQNTNFVDGWLTIAKIEPFEQQLQVQVQGKSQNYTYEIYLPVTWMIRFEHFSIDRNDQRGHVIIDGTFPIYDEAGVMQYPHVSGDFTINADGTGGGDLWLYGQPAAKISFLGRTFGFRGTFSLFSENNEKTYSL